MQVAACFDALMDGAWLARLRACGNGCVRANASTSQPPFSLFLSSSFSLPLSLSLSLSLSISFLSFFLSLARPQARAGVENSLSPKNRDKFTQNLGVFRREINPLTATGNATSPSSPPGSPLGMF
jgi:hypothetical protein